MLCAKAANYFEVKRSRNCNIKGKKIALWNKAKLFVICVYTNTMPVALLSKSWQVAEDGLFRDE